jgi:hypothetical protein
MKDSDYKLHDLHLSAKKIEKNEHGLALSFQKKLYKINRASPM